LADWLADESDNRSDTELDLLLDEPDIELLESLPDMWLRFLVCLVSLDLRDFFLFLALDSSELEEMEPSSSESDMSLSSLRLLFFFAYLHELQIVSYSVVV